MKHYIYNVTISLSKRLIIIKKKEKKKFFSRKTNINYFKFMKNKPLEYNFYYIFLCYFIVNKRSNL